MTNLLSQGGFHVLINERINYRENYTVICAGPCITL
jgi:hypothetical protein